MENNNANQKHETVVFPGDIYAGAFNLFIAGVCCANFASDMIEGNHISACISFFGMLLIFIWGERRLTRLIKALSAFIDSINGEDWNHMLVTKPRKENTHE